MPELPEVETTRRGIEPLVSHQKISGVIVRQPKLRWPVPADLPEQLVGKRFSAVNRRAKYLLFETGAETDNPAECGHMLLHLGMSGSLRVLPQSAPPQKHDHVDIRFDNGECLRYSDPRRFGSIHWIDSEPLLHPLLAKLGPEPLSDEFTGEWLANHAVGRGVAIKNFIMDGHVVVGVGNIYASESLFAAGIHPKRPAGKVSAARYDRLAAEIKTVIARAIDAGGTTLKDFSQPDGKPGYFRIQLAAYGRANEPCINCATPLRHCVLGQRSTYYCPRCQR